MMDNKDLLTPENLALLNSKQGRYALLKNKKINLQKAVEEVRYINSLKERQVALIKIQNWVIDNEKKVVV